ncbi:hypothetical protein [Mycolicibacterium smegmatis]|jgi:hypothetical protein|uniref:hypothetical protein n=1 Tax=Mycolicibacterium smegmatis TaxID=1772 RepID=UPI001300392F|nr:hypothetical protein [Mycolicibacterium smegmatis]
MAMTAQQYREKAETLANQATSISTGTTLSEKGIALATVANVWTYLYEVQSKVDGTITGDAS